MRSKLRGRRDANQPMIVARFEQNFVSVADCADLGDDFPDLVVGIPGLNVLVEVKNPATRGKLTDGQKRFHRDWRGPIFSVATVEDVDLLCEWMRKQVARR